MKDQLNKTFGNNVTYFEEIDSTNTYAKQKKNLSHGELIVARKQTAGRGTYGRQFFSNLNQGVYMSIIIDSNKWMFTHEKLITLLAAVATTEAIKDVLGVSTDVKWVNDLFFERRKIGGILTEKNYGADIYVVGIGINLASIDVEFPDDLQNIAGSLYIKDESTKIELIKQIYDSLINPMKWLEISDVIGAYKKRLFVLNKEVDFVYGDKKLSGFVKDVDECGGIIIEYDGKVEKFTSGEIRIRV